MYLWNVVYEFSSLEERWVWFRDEQRLARFITELPHSDSPRSVLTLRTAHRHHLHWPRTALLSSPRTAPSHPRPHAEQRNGRRPQLPAAPGPSAGSAADSGPAAGARANSAAGTASRRPPLFWRSFREVGGQGPAAARGSRGRRPDLHGCRRAHLPRPPRPAQVAGGLRPFPGRPRLLAPAPGRAAGSGSGAPAASRTPPPSCIGPATWPTEGAGITQGPGKAGSAAAAGKTLGWQSSAAALGPAQPSQARGDARGSALPFEEQPDHEDAEGQGEGEVEVLRLREGGFLRALQVRPGDVVRQPEPLVPEPGEDPCHLCFVCRGAPRSAPPAARRVWAAAGREEDGGVCQPRSRGWCCQAPPCRFPARRGQRPPRLSHGRAGTHWLPPLLGGPPGGPEPPSPAPFPCRKTAPKPETEVTRSEREGPRPRGTLVAGAGGSSAAPTGAASASAPAWRLRALSPTQPFAAQPGSRRAWKAVAR